MYTWHLVDVLRIGVERLLTLRIEPAAGLPCWDEEALADARRYDRLPAAVGLEVLRLAAREWAEVVATVKPEAEAAHAEFGRLGALEIARRNAHEVRHHALDIERWSTA
jgi:hypothetical protein